MSAARPIPVFLCAAALLAASPMRAEAESDGDAMVMAFTVPPFAEEETVDGVDGWKMVSSGKPDHAIVRSFGGTQPGLLLRTYGIERMLENRLDGQVTVTAVVQFGVVSAKGSRSYFSFMPIVNVGVGFAPFGFNNQEASDLEPGGFFYTEKFVGEDGIAVPRKVNLLPREAAFEGARFTFTAVVDLDARSYVLTITGTGEDGQPVKVQSDTISGEAPDKPPVGERFLTGIRLASSLPTSTELFVESITISRGTP